MQVLTNSVGSVLRVMDVGGVQWVGRLLAMDEEAVTLTEARRGHELPQDGGSLVCLRWASVEMVP